MKIFAKIKSFLFNNLIVWVFALLSLMLEMFSNCFIDNGKPYLTEPWYFLAVCSLLCTVMIMTRNKKAQFVMGSVILLMQTALSVGMAFLFFCNGTFFDWAMITMRNDASAILEYVKLEYGLMAIGVGFSGIVLATGIILDKKTTDERIKRLEIETGKAKKEYWIESKGLTRTNDKTEQEYETEKKELRTNFLKSKKDIAAEKKKVKNQIKAETHSKENYKRNNTIFYSVTASVLAGLFLTVALVPFRNGLHAMNESYVNKLYGHSENVYQQKGVSSNAVYEFAKGFFAPKAKTDDIEKVNSFIYKDKAETSAYNGVSAGNNLVLVLVESFEWYAWFAGEHNDYDRALLESLYPNLYKFYDNSLALTNFRQREKTDTSELLAVVGSNPTNKYTNYDFPTNAYPWTLPNVLKSYDKDVNGKTCLTQSFHQNTGEFYNRSKLHGSLGFDRAFFIEEMSEEPYNLVNSTSEDFGRGERTLDSLTFDAMKEEIVPSKQHMLELDCDNFFSFIITFAMHGFYGERENLKNGLNGENYYDKLDGTYDVKHQRLGVYQYDEKFNYKEAGYLRHYAAAVMDFDRALGVLMQRLKDTGHEDDTTIILYSDHNTYYTDLVYFAKGIDKNTDRYNTEAFRIPCMIYDKKLLNAYKANNDGSQVLTKFTTTSDLMPTIFDIFGIPAWKNMYFGNSIFTDVESIVYSRSYGVFVTDKLAGYSVNKLLYTTEGFTDDDLNDFISRATVHLNKLEILDKIYYSDYFKTHTYKKAY